MRKYKIIEKRNFLDGKLKGMTIDHESLSWSENLPNAKVLANIEAKRSLNQIRGGSGFGSKYKVIKAWVVLE
jgi:hypothetical protein